MYHTFNPQLNNITDMIKEVIDIVKTNNAQEINEDLNKARNIINIMIENQIKDKGKGIEDPALQEEKMQGHSKCRYT